MDPKARITLGRKSFLFSIVTFIYIQFKKTYYKRTKSQVQSFFKENNWTNDRDFLDPVSLGGPSASIVARLHSKLQVAARRISQLSQEKEQLIQMGNRLRAELAKHTGKAWNILSFFQWKLCETY